MKKSLVNSTLLLIGSIAWSAVPTSNAPFLKPDEAIAKMEVMNGFEVKAFVAEPDIGEAIAFCFDFRGRLWTLENYNYQTRRAHSTDKRNRAFKYLRIRMGMVYSTRKRHLLKTFLSVLELSWAWAVSMWECLPS